MDVFSMLTQVGSVVGLPAALFLGWMYLSVKDLKKKVEELEAENKRKDGELDSKLAALYDKINAISTDVAYIKGALERKE